MKKRVLVAGCGFVGSETTRIFSEAGWETTGIKLTPESGSIACDISSPDDLRIKCGEFRGVDLIVDCVSASGGSATEYRRVYLDGARNLLEILQPKKFIFTSSTSVYAQTDGAWVDEQSRAEPIRETGKVLRETEELVLQNGGIVARLAGIYGPGRSVLLRKFFDGTAVLDGAGERWINQIHRSDAADAIHFLSGQKAGEIYNVADDHPLTQRDFYAWLSARFNLSMPPSHPPDLDRKRGWTNKRVSNAKLRALGWRPRFSSFQNALTPSGEISDAPL